MSDIVKADFNFRKVKLAATSKKPWTVIFSFGSLLNVKNALINVWTERGKD